MPARTSPYRKTPRIVGNMLTDGEQTMLVDSPKWVAWLATATRFSLVTTAYGNVLFRKEQRQRGGSYWSAYRRVGGRTYHVYGGKESEMNLAMLETTAKRLADAIAPYEVPKVIGKRKIELPQIQVIRFGDQMIWFDLTDGRILGVPLSWFPTLERASEHERAAWQLIGNNTGVAWEALDEHLSVRVLMNLPS